MVPVSIGLRVGRRRPAKIVKLYLKPFINLLMDCNILITYFSWGYPFLPGLYFSCRPILVCTTYVQCISLTNMLTISGIYVGREYTANNVTDVWDIVHVWQSARD